MNGDDLAPARIATWVRASALASAVLGIALSGCTKTDARDGGAHAYTQRDTVRIGMYEEPDTLNPVITSMSFSSDVMQLLYDGLIRYDDKGNPVPDLARELPTLANGGISSDRKTLTYHLMPNARWHDGVPLTSADVIFTWQAIMNPRNSTPTRTGYERITSMDAPDAHTVRLHFAKPYAPSIYLFKDLNQGAIVPKHILGGLSDINHAAFNAKPVGSGPYVLDRWSHGSEITFHANHAYFRGTPKIEHVVMRFIPNQNTLTGEVRAHEIDVAAVPPIVAAQLKTVPGIAEAETSTLQWEHLAFNNQHAPLDDVAVRRALCAAIDEKAIFRNFYFGYGRMAPTHFNPEFGWGDPSLAYLPFDVAAAGRSLDADGWKLAGDGFRYKNGKRFAFEISTVAGVKPRERVEVFLQSEWRAIGADVGVHNYPAALLFAPAALGGMLPGGKTDVSLFAFDNTTPDPDDESYIGPNSFPPKAQNYPFYRNEEIGRLQETGLTTFASVPRHAVYRDISRILIRDVPEYVLDWEADIVAYDDDLMGIRPVPVGSNFWNIASWSYK